MENTSTREVTFRQAQRPPPAKVEYPAHLWRTASRDALIYLVRAETRLMVFTSMAFSISAAVTWRMFASPSIMHGAIAVLVGVVAVLLSCGLVVAAHFLYWTPKKLCLAKHQQLEEERARQSAEMNRTMAALTAREKKIEELQLAIKAMKYETEGVHSQIGDEPAERRQAVAS
jgi:hypothetical protein